MQCPTSYDMLTLFVIFMVVFFIYFLMVIHAVAKIHYFEVQIFVVPAPTCFCEIVFIYWTGFLSKTALHCSVIF